MDVTRKQDLRTELETMMATGTDPAVPLLQLRVANLARIVLEVLNEVGPSSHAEATAAAIQNRRQA